jgi:hypothetical protein
MTTPFNREKLESLAYLDADGRGVIAARNFHADLPLYHGPNVRFSVCMDGAGNARDAAELRTDKLGMQTVIYANTTASLEELMLENGARRVSPLRLTASSSDEKNYRLVLEISPEGSGAQYSTANLAHVARISAQHLPMTLVSQALQACQERRRDAVVAYMATKGVHEIDARTFYMTLPMGSLYDITAPSSTGRGTSVDITQWQALVEKTSEALAETHTLKLCEVMVKFLTHAVATAGVPIGDPAAVRAHLARLEASAEGRAALVQGFMTSLQKTHEGSFIYTSDSKIQGFAVQNTVTGVRLQAQFASSGEKQNLFGMDPLTSNLTLERNARLFAARSEEQYRAALECTTGGELVAAAAAYSTQMTRANEALGMYKTQADCEDGASTLAALTHVAHSMDPAHLAECVSKVFASGLFSSAAGSLEASVQAALRVLHGSLGDKHVGLCFAHAANVAQVKTETAVAADAGVLGNYQGLVQQINASQLTGHACLFSLDGAGAARQVAPLLLEQEFTGLRAHESTNPIEVAKDDPRCSFATSSSEPGLDAKLVGVNGRIPLSFAMSVVSEISAKGARNVTGCDANAVTYTSADSPFYHTLIAAKGYAYSEQGGVCLPTVHISTLRSAATRHFLVQAALLEHVGIAGTQYTEDELLDIVVGSASCLAPSLEQLLHARTRAGFHVYASLPPSRLPDYTRVVMRGRVTPMPGPQPPALHASEEHARRIAALALHPQAIAVSSNSQCWDIYIPHSA